MQFSFISRQILRSILYFLTGFILISASSCIKSEDKVNSKPVGLAFVNATTKADSAFIFIDGKQINEEALRYSQMSGYYSINNLNHLVEIINRNKLIARGLGSFEQGKYFTLYITRTADTTILVGTEDDLARPQSGKGRIRFANMSYNAPGLSASFENGATVATQTIFKAAAPFIEVSPGTYNLDVRDASKPDQQEYLFRGIKVESGKSYTIWGDGLWGDKTPQTGFDIHVFEHK
jgi:hypothetical protein